MGTETTSASYRRTQNPLVTKFFYGITGIQRNRQRTLVTNPSFQTQFFYHLINASRNIFLDALVAAFINGTWPLINSTYQFLFPDNSFCHGFLQALYRRLSEPHRFVSNVCCRFLLYSSNSHETQSLFAELLEYKKVPTTLDTN